MGVFKLKPEGLNPDDLELEQIDAGLEEMGEGSGENGDTVLSDPGSFQRLWQYAKSTGRKKHYPISSEVEWIPGTTVQLGEEAAQEVL